MSITQSCAKFCILFIKEDKSIWEKFRKNQKNFFEWEALAELSWNDPTIDVRSVT